MKTTGVYEFCFVVAIFLMPLEITDMIEQFFEEYTTIFLRIFLEIRYIRQMVAKIVDVHCLSISIGAFEYGIRYTVLFRFVNVYINFETLFENR